jgi:uracil-DNA glycosylase family 4
MESNELLSLYNEVRKCRRCSISSLRENTDDGKLNGKVVGGGKFESVFFIGIAPSCFRRGMIAFTDSKLGATMTKFLSEIGLKREDVFFSNILKCSVENNRKPTDDEIGNCKKWLILETECVKPKLIVFMGADAAKCFNMKIGDVSQIMLPEVGMIKTYAIYHPAAFERGVVSYAEYAKQFKKISELM